MSAAQRTASLVSEQVSLYGNTSTYVEAYASMPLAIKYNNVHTPNGFMDADNGVGNYVDYFVKATDVVDQVGIYKYNGVYNRFDIITLLDDVKSITFDVKKLGVIDTNGSKYILNYTIETDLKYTLTGGVVMNNTVKGKDISTGSYPIKIDASDLVGADHAKVLRLRSTSRQNVDRS